jgi:hypothetical protein
MFKNVIHKGTRILNQMGIDLLTSEVDLYVIWTETKILPLKYSLADPHTRFASNVSICWSLSHFHRRPNIAASEQKLKKQPFDQQQILKKTNKKKKKKKKTVGLNRAGMV